MVYKFIERSKGVVIFSVLLMAAGGFNAILLLVSLNLIPFENSVRLFNGLLPHGLLSMSLFWTSSFLNIFIFLSWVIAGVGILHLKEWARQYLRVVMSVYLINMIINVCLNVFLAQELDAKVPTLFIVIGTLISLLYYLAVTYFFSHPSIVRQFKYKSKEY